MKRHGESSSCSAEVNSGAAQRAFRVEPRRSKVCYVREVVAARDIAKRSRIRKFYRASKKLGICSRDTTVRSRAESTSVISPQETEGGFAQPHCRVEHCVEDRGEIAGRGVDDLQDLGGRGLLLQALVAPGIAFVEPLLQLSVGTLKIGNGLPKIG
jgi:hypothetical protein